MQKLLLILEGRRLDELSTLPFKSCYEIFKAFKNLVKHHQIFLLEDFNSNETVTTFCNLTRLHPKQDKELDDRLKPIVAEVFIILDELTKHLDVVRFLVINMHFVKFMIRSLRDSKQRLISAPEVHKILCNIFSFADILDLSEFFIKTGLIFFVLEFLFKKDMKKEEKLLFLSFLMNVHEMTSHIYTNFMPYHFFIEV